MFALRSRPVSPPRGRRAFVRTQVSLIERTVALLVVCSLGGIGTAIWWKGRHFDPGLYSLRADALKSTAGEVTGKSSTLRTQAGGEPGETESAPVTAVKTAKPATESAEISEPGSEPAAGAEEGHPSPAAAPKPVKGEPLEIALPGIKPMGDTEYYTAETLYEKIDGRSGAYTGFNCQGLRCRSFAVANSKSSYVDVYEYKMDTPVNAFGIFALERDPKGKPVDFASDGYAGEMGFFFRQGAFYIQIIASDVAAPTLEAAKAIARNRAGAVPVDNTGLDARRRLPSVGLIPESVSFVQDNAQGQDFLKNVFQAVYRFDGANLPFFLMVATPQEAAAGWNKYNAFCARFGKATTLPDLNGAKVFQAESFGKFRIVYQKAGEIGGVFDAGEPEKARRFVESYLKGDLK